MKLSVLCTPEVEFKVALITCITDLKTYKYKCILYMRVTGDVLLYQEVT